MADYYDDYDVGDGGPSGGFRAQFAQRLSVWTGAFLAVTIVGGVAYWGYGLTTRDVGAIPVIRAALGPVKVAPEAPVEQATIPKEKITSYGAGSQTPAPAKAPTGEPQLAFAPPPERPAAEDVPMGALQAGGAALQVPTLPAPALPATGAPAPEQPTGSELAPVASPPVLSRPADLGQRVAVAQAEESEATKLAAAAAASAVQIQLGAFPEREKSEAEWLRIYKANEDILHGRTLVIQSTVSGGQRYFRMRVGPFRDRIEAQNICRALQARKQDCLVAVNN